MQCIAYHSRKKKLHIVDHRDWLYSITSKKNVHLISTTTNAFLKKKLQMWQITIVSPNIVLSSSWHNVLFSTKHLEWNGQEDLLPKEKVSKWYIDLSLRCLNPVKNEDIIGSKNPIQKHFRRICFFSSQSQRKSHRFLYTNKNKRYPIFLRLQCI